MYPERNPSPTSITLVLINTGLTLVLINTHDLLYALVAIHTHVREREREREKVWLRTASEQGYLKLNYSSPRHHHLLT